MKYQEKLEQVIDELTNNAFVDSSPYWVIEAYGLLENCDTTEKTYQEIGMILGIDENNIDRIDTENDKELLEIVQDLLNEAHEADRDNKVFWYGEAQEFVTEYSIGKPENDFITDYSVFIDFEGVAKKMYDHDDNIRIFNDDYYVVYC